MHGFDFSSLYRSSIGFDRLVDLLESETSSSDYPYYNVELVGENKYRIAISVVGFSEGELEITAHDNLLIVKGTRVSEKTEKKYLYQGISEHNFERQFQLAEYIQIKGANLSNGLLSIDLERVVPEKMKPRRITID